MDILIVDDEPVDAKLARVVLAFEGHAVVDVGAAELAIPAIRLRKPHLIVLDLALPGMDGLTFAHQLKQDPETHHIVIVAVTAFSDRWSRRAVITAGCDALLIKPFATRALCAQVADIAQEYGYA